VQSFSKHTACLFLAKHTIKEVFSIIQNVFSVPHSLDLSPFWNVLSMSNKEACRSVFFVTLSVYWVYLCGTKNRRMVSVYGVVDPFDLSQSLVTL